MNSKGSKPAMNMADRSGRRPTTVSAKNVRMTDMLARENQQIVYKDMKINRSS